MNRPTAAVSGLRITPRVVVGVDGSPGARAALEYALIEAGRRRARLEVVAAFTMELPWTAGIPLDTPDVPGMREEVERQADDLLREVRETPSVSAHPGVRDVDVEVLVERGPAARTLVEHSSSSDLLVVGSRGRGGMRSALLGSVALHCVTHAHCPVVVIHVGGPTSAEPRVMVGVDHSAGARAALVAAVEEAALRGADLDVVVSYGTADYWNDLATVVAPSAEAIHAELRRRTAEEIEEVLAQRPVEAVRPNVQIVVGEGPAGDVLVQHARAAQLLVVGCHGHGAFRGLLLGSIALHCAMHAPCPVMVVHPESGRVEERPMIPRPAMAHQ